jgi:hypothetical protein
MNEMTSSNQPKQPPGDLARTEPRGELQRQLRELFPDLDPDIVAKMLELTERDGGEVS